MFLVIIIATLQYIGEILFSSLVCDCAQLPINLSFYLCVYCSQMQAALGSPNETTSLRAELKQAQSHLQRWFESWKQAKDACEAWKKEAEETSAKARLEREDAIRRIEELELALREAENKMRIVQAQGPIRALAENAELTRLPMSNLEQIQQLLQRDLERVEAVSKVALTVISC